MHAVFLQDIVWKLTISKQLHKKMAEETETHNRLENIKTEI